jgi:hypothetical protein
MDFWIVDFRPLEHKGIFIPPKSHEVFYNKNEILNIINWVDRLRVNHYILPTFDNSGPTDAAILSLTGHGEFNYGVVGASLNNYLVEYVAIVGGNDIEVTKDLPKDFDAMVDAGNILIRNETSKSYQTFLMLCEKETAIDEAASIFDGTHEDEDMGSWSLFVQNSFKSQSMQMVVDPPYAGYTLSDGTNKFDMHNVIQIHTLNTPNYDQYKNPKFEKKQKSAFGITEFNLVYDWKENKNSTLVGNAISRNVISLNLEGNIYYILNDFIDATNVEDFTKTTFILNGNGNEDNSSYRKTGNIHIWDYPCNLPGNWSLTTHHCSLKGGLSASGFEEKTLTKNEWNFTGSAALGISGGYLTRLKINQTNEKTIYQSFIYPQVCGSILPTIFKRDSGDFVSTTIHFVTGKDTSFEARLGKNNTGNLVNDTSCHLHLARLEGNIADSASNPFNLPNQSNKKLYFNGQKLFVNYHTLSYMGKGYKYCPPSYANFRTVKVDNGSYLIFNDTLFLSTILLDFQSTIIGRQTYSCLINPLTTATASDTIIIKLPDVGRGVEMIAIASGNDTIPSRYDSLSNYFYMSIPQGKKEFTIQEKQACQDCYFPPVGTHIDTLFEADDGNRHTLGNKKRINYPDGNMVISNATRINMCPGVYLQNKDSLIIYGQPQSKGFETSTCAGIESIANASNNSMLIVSPGSALVLDAGSRTYVKPGGAIYVKQNGSLVIKDGAFLQIGDSTRVGWGEIIAEQGAYIYIEPNAHIEYRRMIGDTADRNLFHIATGSQPAYAGVYYWMDSMLKAENIIASTIFPIDICSLDSLVPFYNKDWGYTNFAKPVANLTLRNDTLCPGEPLVIRMNRILNDAMAEIRVCRWDSVFVKGVFAYMDCVNDSVLLDSIPPDPICRQPRTMPDEWIYYFGVNTKHQVSFTLMNECGRIVDTSFLVVVRDTPHFDFNIPATACEGYETVVATAYEGTGDSVYYSFEVTEVLDTATINNQIENPGEVYSQTFYGLVPDSFRFEGYYFRGGRKYNISLSITNNCGTSTQEKILEIPLGAYIKMERSTLYANPIHGARSVQLHGYVSPIDSFRWEPLTWLNRGDTLVVTSTPQDSIAYILMAFKDECIAYDTAIIRVRHVANAGVGDTICYNHGKVLLGNAYDMSVFLGYLYFKGGMDFRNMYTTKTSLDETYFQYFSLYMQTQGFKDWANSCANLYEDFTELLHREQTIHQNWYISYFENLTAFDHPLMYPLDTFVYYVSNDSALNSNYTSVNDWDNLGGCIDEMFVNYEEFKQNQLSSINISWYRITDTDTSYTSSIQESSIAIDEPTVTSSYIQTVITESYAEIDQTIVWMDTVVTAAFGVQFQFDSTVIFENFTLPETAGNSYSWNFGDGSAVSTDKNALHEFPKFDTSYLVCLSVTNNCGTSMFCDTVYIDSAHWGGSLRATDKKPIHTTLANSGSNLMRAVFYPNPVESFGILSYEFEPDENSGEIQITDSQGKLVYSKNLSQQKEQIFIPTTHLAPGMYFYVLSCRNGETLQGKFIK